jgi:S-DNA-T family DNA segregation ATPase FtsK/SpoIIIE
LEVNSPALIVVSLLILITEQSFVEIIKWIGRKLKIFGAFVANKFTLFMKDRKKQIDLMRQESRKRREEDKKQTDATAQKKQKEEHERPVTKNKKNKKDPFTHIIDSELREEKHNSEITIEEDPFDDIKEPLHLSGDESVKKVNEPLTDAQISFFEEKKKKQNANQLDEETIIAIQDDVKSYETRETNKTMYEFPPIELLKSNPFAGNQSSKDHIRKSALILQETFNSFGVGAKVINVISGPTVTRYEVQPDVGVKVNRITNLADDIALKMAANGIRIEAPIPGKTYIGIEIPNKQTSSVFIREVIETEYFKKFPSKIAFALGKDIDGEVIVPDISRMPHMLIAGATGSGKSVCINSLITSILFRAHPDEVKFILIDSNELD